MWPAYRVRARAVEASDELRWVLVRAFGPAEAAVPRAIDAPRAIVLARQLDVASRIATRHELTLPDELGHEAARQLGFQRLQALALDRVLSALRSEVVTAAAGLAIPVVLLKHAALRRSGWVQEGERNARDVDVLVPRARASELQRQLNERGFRSGASAPSLHLPTLTRHPGEAVEIHHCLWGLRLAGSARDMSAEDLISGRCEPASDGSFIPKAEVLAAHAIVHGLIQHRTSPRDYPAIRALADLVVLGLSGNEVEARCQEYVRHVASPALTRAALRLSSALRAGVDVFTLDRAGPEFQLLSHVVASSEDDAYRRALRFERILELRGLRDASAALGRALGRRDSASTPGEPKNVLAEALELARSAASYAAHRVRRGAR